MSPGNTVALMFGGYDFMHLTMEIIHHPQRSTKPFLNPPWMIRICSHEQHEQPPTATMSRNWHLGLSPSARGNRHLWPWWPGSKLLSCTWCEQYRILVRQWKWWYNITQKCPILKIYKPKFGPRLRGKSLQPDQATKDGALQCTEPAMAGRRS